ncbi:MAG: 7-cyano-7-deazaguanine synthase [Methanobacteriaceae archaeon]|nr:7-cyano-7-deazaguanine synthase [Methanobacteriaceae archaeon]
MYTKEFLTEEIIKIRKEIGHDNITPNIKDIYYNNNELTIITPDRPDKSIIIGKGGWVVGKLREELGLNSIHIISYSDIILQEYKLKLSLEHMNNLIKTNNLPRICEKSLNELKTILNKRYTEIYQKEVLLDDFIQKNINKEPYNDKHDTILALSGGVDSSFSLILAKSIGLNIKAVTINPGTIILPKQFHKNIDNLTTMLNIDHKYVKIDMQDTIKKSLSGKIHPCGQCSKNIHQEIDNITKKYQIPIQIYGDLLSTTTHSITTNNNITKINMPSLLYMQKHEIKNIITKFKVKKIKEYGCPLLHEVHKKHPHMKDYSIQRVLRETRAGNLESGEAANLIKTI